MGIVTLNHEEPLPDSCRHGALTIGNFDGVHLGHAALLAEARQQAQAVGGPAVALTFDPHPLRLLRPDVFQPLLTTPADRAALLLRAGADHVVIQRTTPAFLQQRARDFFDGVVKTGFAARALVEGDNFGFGRHREGDVEMLRTLCREAGIPLSIVPPREVNGRRVSSSRVRTALERGDVADAAALCGRPYRLSGTVGAGAQRGRTLGFPTANLEHIETLVPGDGVYAVRAWVAGRPWPGAANIGPNPTFAEQARKVEVHLIGFNGDLYGQALPVDFVARLRDTRPFAGVDELTKQLHLDVAAAQRLVSESERQP